MDTSADQLVAVGEGAMNAPDHERFAQMLSERMAAVIEIELMFGVEPMIGRPPDDDIPYDRRIELADTNTAQNCVRNAQEEQ